MAFTVQLFSFSKKENSTARPSSSSATSFNCVLKAPSGILSPTIQLDIGLSNAPSSYNYAYIPSFNRYYWIEEWTNNGALWEASLNVDVLATYKTEIGASSLYVLRSSATYDGNIMDTAYTTKTNASTSRTEISKPHDKRTSVGQDGFIVGLISTQADTVISSMSAQYGSVKYEYFTKNGLATLIRYLMDVNNWGSGGFGFDLNDCSLQLQKSLVDPLQYIKSCMWVPYTMQASIVASNLDFYGWTIPNVEHIPLSSNTNSIINTESVLVDIPKHPSTNSRGNYVNLDPYTKLWLSCPPYGVIELDTSITANISQINLTEALDLLTGKAILSITSVSQSGVVDINKLEAQLGVPIQISQVSRDWLGVAQGTAQVAIGTAQAATGAAQMIGTLGLVGDDDVAKGAMTALGGAVDAYRAYIPKSQSLGGGGGFVDVAQRWYINSEFFNLVEDDNTRIGRPLYANRVVSSLGGYIQAKNGSIGLNATSRECRAVRSFLEGGFYYE